MDSTKQRFFSPCPRGLEGVLETELRSLGVETTRKTEGGVGYDASWTSLYRVNLTSRIASRVLWEVGKAHCRTEDDIYRAAYALTWPDWFQRSCTMKVKVSARHSMLKSLDFITLRIKDAVCDKFVRTAGGRPNVDTQKPDVRIDAFLDGPSVVFYLDTSGEPLFKRGYRMDRAEAPLRENLAAGLIGLTGWTPDEAFVDPMCGGGTIPTEAAFIARRIPAGIMRSFAFERLSLHDVKIWNRIRDTAWKDQLDTVPSVIYASDKDPNAVKMAQRTFQGAGVGIDVRLKQADFFSLEPPLPGA